MNIQNEFQAMELFEYDAESAHSSLEDEYTLFQAVKSGNASLVRKYCFQNSIANLDGKGVFSTNQLRNIKYHFAIFASLLARQCFDGGLEYELTFRLNNFYILKMDALTTVESVVNLYNTMLLDFTHRMATLNCKENFFSKPIVICKEYIYSHLGDRITINALAEHVNLSPNYLSRLFKKEVGMSVSAYIRTKKIEKTENLLRFSNYTLIEIANFLAFSSQSHFIQTFEKQIGLTPKKYRDKFHCSLW